MIREIEFRAWDRTSNKDGKMVSWDEVKKFPCEVTFLNLYPEVILMQYIGIKDKNDKKYFIGDRGRFDNGDIFVLKMENWLEVFIEWEGDPECEDQGRDLYRISKAEIIGNIYE